jgi:hypothetical protein
MLKPYTHNSEEQYYYNSSILHHFILFFLYLLDESNVFLFFLQLPLAEKCPSFLNVLEVDDPKLCVLLHLMTPMEPIEPVLESPLVRPLAQQKTAASDLLTEVGSAKTAMEGMLLSNMEKNGNN